MPALRPAAFLDRDGTIIAERNYISDPDDVLVLASAADGLRALRAAGFLLIVVTNQSGIARGLVTPEQYEAVNARMIELLRADGVELDAIYCCPHHPDFTGPCDCRKPGSGLYERAAREHRVDLSRSMYIGDKASDVTPANRLGGTGILVRTGHGSVQAAEVDASIRTVDDLAEAAVVAGALPERE